MKSRDEMIERDSSLKNFSSFWRRNFDLMLISAICFVALLNPVFKKYDYGAEYPLVLIFAFLVGVMAVKNWKKPREHAAGEFWTLAIFGILMILSWIFSETRNWGFSEILAWISAAVLYGDLAWRKIEWQGKFWRFLKIISLIGVLMGFAFYIFQPETRMFGPFFNILYHANEWPNAFALFLLMVWPVCLISSTSVRTGKARFSLRFRLRAVRSVISSASLRLGGPALANFLQIGALSLVLSALILTYSRGAILVLGGQIILLFIYFFKHINRKRVVKIFTVGLMMAGIILLTNLWRSQNFEVIDVEEKVKFENAESLTSKVERKNFWNAAIEMALEKPFSGYGPFSFRQIYNPRQEALLANSDHPHNVFLKFAAENGIFVAVAFLSFLVLVLAVFMRRFSLQDQKTRDQLFLLFVAATGAIAHNLIDYNFNFLINLILFWLILAFARSLLIRKKLKNGKEFPAAKGIATVKLTVITSGVLLIILTVFESSIWALAYAKDQKYFQYSFFPRNYYLNVADQAIAENDLNKALAAIREQKNLNIHDDRAFYLEGVVRCKMADWQGCYESFNQALELNPLNEIGYYRDLLRMLPHLKSMVEIKAQYQDLQKTKQILETYFDFVERNVHFTAYTPNVEAAVELADLLAKYLNPNDSAVLLKRKDQIWKKALELRKNKAF